MKAVTDITRFFLKGLTKMCDTLRPEGTNIVQLINKSRIQADDPLNEETEGMMTMGVKISTLALITSSVADIVNAINAAGSVLVRVGMPDEANVGDDAMTPEQLRAAAKAAAEKLAAIQSIAKAVSMSALELVDFDHIVEHVMEKEMPAIREAEKARTAGEPSAKPIHGTATPLNRWAPSQN